MEKRILLVEDNAHFRKNFARALKRALAADSLDVVFVEAGSLKGARARLQEGGLDAALIDVRLPNGDGLDLVRGLINDRAAGRIPCRCHSASFGLRGSVYGPGQPHRTPGEYHQLLR